MRRASSDRGESAATLEKHLEWVERGVKMLVTNAGLETALAKNAKFDVGRALATATRADEVLGQLARNLSWETCYVFDTYTAVRVRAEVRETVARAMVEAMKTVTKPFACVAFGDDGRVGAYAKPRGHRPTTIAASDLIVLMNFLRVVSRCEGDEDSFTRVCLPEFNPDGFMRAYTARLRARDEAVYNTSKNSVDRDGVAGDFTVSEMRAISLRAPQDSGPSWDASRKPPEGAMRSYPA